MNSYKNDICYILIFCLDLNYYITFQKSKCTVMPGTQTKPWIVFVHYLNSTQHVTSNFTDMVQILVS